MCHFHSKKMFLKIKNMLAKMNKYIERLEEKVKGISQREKVKIL